MMLSALDSPRQQLAEIDHALLWSALLLLLGGLVMVYSASIAIAEAGRFTNNQPAYYLIRHTIFLCIGLVAGAVAFQLPLTVWQKYAPVLFMIGVVLLAIVLIPGIGKDVNGARRWLPLGFANLQPSELMKLFAVLYAADYTIRKINVMHDLKQAFLPMFGAMALVGILLLKEPDFGAFVVIISIAMGILFLGGLKARMFALLIVGLLIAFAIMIIVSPYRRDRIFGFMDPWADAFGRGYQLSHSLIAFGRGELFGVGLGASVEKLFYLPEAHTDFLLAVIGEELGFVGVLTVIALFAVLVQRAFAIGRQCVQLDRLYPALVAMGIGIWLGVQSFINMGVNVGLLPTKGLTLPLMSFGGSGILANCVALAILLRVDWENRQLMRGGKL
ncbi:putative lipid II flippase FtsW [Azonexus hydrophilus]|jgi:cell division protein FtsW|uniref:Probable peptidoglycan glycosyltransferase FtsW n=1 Tax=Azonexus hydrophilus TaxID=418702 RepID=A0ABZ2XGD2_9RHOO|nr:putative lipid II flippase FtsW [Azonexus hydrophilus]MBS4019269.1 putative lipid II flippase FtsW [Dechloromonas sp.]